MDDVLGDTAFALAYRWATAERGERTWPGALLVAQKATDRTVEAEAMESLACCRVGEWAIAEGAPPSQGRGWTLLSPKPLTIHVDDARLAPWEEVDRIADIASAWLGIDWRILSR